MKLQVTELALVWDAIKRRILLDDKMHPFSGNEIDCLC